LRKFILLISQKLHVACCSLTIYKLKKKHQQLYILQQFFCVPVNGETEKNKINMVTIYLIEFLKSEKEPKIRMGATRRNLQAQPKIQKKNSEHQIENFPKRKYV
jgi:hypothetical protein